MKIVLATPLYPPEPGGPATYAQLLVEHWTRSDETSVSKSDEILLVKFSDVRHLPKGVRHLVYFWKILRAAKHADIVLALDPVSVGFPAFEAARLARKPFVVKIVGDFAWEQGRQRFGISETLDEFVMLKEDELPWPVTFFRNMETYVAKRARTIIVPSNYLKKIVGTWSNEILPENIHVIYNSIQLPDFIPGLSDQSAIRIVSAGRLVPWKGMSELIDAVAEAQKEFPDATLTIVGDGPERAALEGQTAQLVEEGKLAAHTITFTGALPHAEALAHYRSAGIYVQNSSYEGLSHQIIEALMLGRPIIATNVGGNPELIQDGENGILVEWGDQEALVGALKNMLGDEGMRARFSARAASASPATFNVPTMIQKTRELLSSLLLP
jgi:glycosyltransferase involved in cell wall biosynthesis